jgi:shikimate kinase
LSANENTFVNIALIGYRGTGKTTVARLLAESLACDWIDSDDEIERTASKSIAEIFAGDGEPHFRDLETAALRRLCQQDNTVLALGGGAVIRRENREILSAVGHVVWLEADVDTIFHRVAADATTAARRPNLTIGGGREEIAQLLADRTPVYRECATLAVDTLDKSPQQVAREILAQVRPDSSSA